MSMATNDLAALAWSQIWQVTMLAAFVGMTTRLCCRRRPHLAYMLWMLVLLKCLTPPLWSSPTGLFSWAQCRVGPARSDGRAGDAAAPLNAERGGANVLERPDRRNMSTGPSTVVCPVEEMSPVVGETAASSWRDRVSPAEIAAVVWILGALGLAGLMWRRGSAYRRMLQRSAVPGDVVARTVAQLRERLRLRRAIRVVITPEPIGPAVFGLLRPVVVLPRAVVAGKTPQQIEPILAHELVHLRRGDVYWGAMQLAVEVLWWFHPLVWWANRETCRQRERCCDHEVVAGLEFRPAAYARCLLDVLELGQGRQPMLAISGRRSKKDTSNRLEDIMSHSRSFCGKPPRWSWAVLIVAAVLVLPGRAMVLGQSGQDEPNTAAAPSNPTKPILAVRLYHLNYVTSSDAASAIKELKSPQGKITALPYSQTGLSNGNAGRGGGGRRASGVRPAGDDSLAGGEVLIVQDFEDVLKKTDRAIAKLDVGPAQVLIEGTCADSAGKTIPDAHVAVVGRLRNPSTDAFLTDDLKLLGMATADGEGRFYLSLPKLSSAAYYSAHAVAVADGYNLGWQPVGLDVARPQVKVTLGKEQTIHGRLLDSSGKPAAEAKVYVTGIGKPLPGDSDGIQSWKPPSQLPFWPKPATTDADGRFTLRGVDRSQILNVQVRDDRFAIDWLQIGRAGEKDPHVTVNSAGEVPLSPQPARIFQGQISHDDTHQPVAKARVEIGASFDPFRCIMNMTGQTDADGRFRLNPWSGKIFYIKVCPPDGEPYLCYEKEIKLAAGQQPPKLEIALPRGVLLRGTITEKTTSAPVAGAALKYEDHTRPPYRPDRILPDHSSPSVRGTTRSDGVFQIAVPPGHGTLFVQGPNNDYIRQTINTWDFHRTNVGFSRRYYVAAYVSLDLNPNESPAKLAFTIRRGATVHGTIVGPDGQAPGDVLILSRHFIGAHEEIFNGGNIRAKDGQFAIHGLDPDVATPFYFLDPKHETGATVEISGKSADNGPLVVHLQPCGKAVARFVTPDGKPKAKHEVDLSILVSPGPFLADNKRNKKEVSSDQDFVANFDRQHYWNPRKTDADGRCTLPDLIPGATYRIPIFNKLGDWDEKDFTVKPGETLQLPDITVKTK